MSPARILSVLMGSIVSAAVLAADCLRETAAVAGMHRQAIHLRNERDAVVTLSVRVADERHERLAGFQHLCPTPEQEPMLFVFPTSVISAFHMRNVQLALDIAFIGEDGRFLEVMRMEPGVKLYAPRSRFRYALEAPAGTFAHHGLGAGGSRLAVDALTPWGGT